MATLNSRRIGLTIAGLILSLWGANSYSLPKTGILEPGDARCFGLRIPETSTRVETNCSWLISAMKFVGEPDEVPLNGEEIERKLGCSGFA